MHIIPSRPTHPCRLASLLAAIMLLPVGLLSAQVVTVPTTPQIGSSNPVTAAPLVSRPSTQPCVVQLFSNLEFADFTPKVFSYTPPANCPGPWAKVVFTADFTVTMGRQFDRTAAFYLGHASIYYGTTAEPRHNLSPSWHVERDVTDLSAIFKSDQTGEANIGNFVGVSGGVTYDGLIYSSAALEFYPASPHNPAPRVPDIVVPVNGAGGDAGTLNTTTDSISQTLNLPMNVEQVYLDVIAQNQHDDEFFYFNVPNDQAANLESNGGTAFRETEISIDGTPAGVAPVYPWIFTGGVDPYWWEPITGNQTLDFKPYRVDLTPFAALLSDGNPHTVAISVFNADSYFLATANLLVYTDHGKSRVNGMVTTNTLASAPTPIVIENIAANSNGSYTGSISDESNRSFTISGFVNTSHGHVVTTVQERVHFINTQEFDVNPGTGIPDDQDAQQDTTVDSLTSTQQGNVVTSHEERFDYPLTMNYSFIYSPDYTTGVQTASVQQGYKLDVVDGLFGHPVYTSRTSENTSASDTLNFDFVAGTDTPSNPQTTQTYSFHDSLGRCYSETLTAANSVLTGVTNNCH